MSWRGQKLAELERAVSLPGFIAWFEPAEPAKAEPATSTAERKVPKKADA